MTDREKVFDALRNCITEPKCKDCPWEDCEKIGHKRVNVPVTLLLDALNLLKEEPVKPVVNRDEWVCGCCGLAVEQQRMIHPGAIFHDFFEYCPHCGKKVDWKAVKQDETD